MATVDNGKAPLTMAQYGSKEHQKQNKQLYITKEEVIYESMQVINSLPLSKRWPLVFNFLLHRILDEGRSLGWPYEGADKYIGVYAGFAGLVCNSYFRRMLMIRKGLILSSLPMFLAPALTVKLGWYHFVTTPILAGDLPCSICGEMRGGLVNVGLGVLYPLLIAFPLSTTLALKHRTVELPDLSQAWRNWPKFSQFWVRKMRFFKVQFATVAVFQGIIGVFLAKKQMDVYRTELKMKYQKVEEKSAL